MSWGATYTINPDGKSEIENFSVKGPDAVEAFEAASNLADYLVEKGVVGDITKTFKVSLSGHANPDHEPKSGWANDFVQITITQVEEK
jgi:hypothetical protein